MDVDKIVAMALQDQQEELEKLGGLIHFAPLHAPGMRVKFAEADYLFFFCKCAMLSFYL